MVQNDLHNRSRLRTTVVCLVTSNLRRADLPMSVPLREGEAGLARRSVVNVTQMYTVDRGDLDEYVGTLSQRRTLQVVRAAQALLDPFDASS